VINNVGEKLQYVAEREEQPLNEAKMHGQKNIQLLKPVSIRA